MYALESREKYSQHHGLHAASFFILEWLPLGIIDPILEPFLLSAPHAPSPTPKCPHPVVQIAVQNSMATLMLLPRFKWSDLEKDALVAVAKHHRRESIDVLNTHSSQARLRGGEGREVVLFVRFPLVFQSFAHSIFHSAFHSFHIQVDIDTSHTLSNFCCSFFTVSFNLLYLLVLKGRAGQYCGRHLSA